MYINTDGIILKAVKYSERDVILTVFTRKLGKIVIYAKGLRASKSKLSAGTQIFSYSNFMIKKSKNMYSLIQVEPKISFFDLSKDIYIFTSATYIAQLTEKAILENQTNNRLFKLLLECMIMYMKEDFEKAAFITRIFEVKFLEYTGYKPILNICVNCGQKPSKDFKFSTSMGGVLCGNCKAMDKYSKKVDFTTIRLMSYILKTDVKESVKAKVSSIILKELKDINIRYIREHLEDINFKSINMLENL